MYINNIYIHKYSSVIMRDELDYMIKIILVGDSRVGKTAYFNRLQKKMTYLQASTIGVDYCSIKKYYDENYVKINIWDTAGQERFNTIITSYFKEIGGIILMFNVNEPQSIDKLEKWLKHVNAYTQCSHKYEHPILLLGNKTDKENKICMDELNHFIQEHNITYKEISCKTDTNEYLEEVFDTFIEFIIKNQSGAENICKGVKRKDEIIQLRQCKKTPRGTISNCETESSLVDCCILA